MQRRYNLTHFILAGVVVLGLTPLMVVVDAQARIVFQSNRDGHVHPRLGWPTSEIYVMEVDGNNQRRLTNNPNLDRSPSWSPDGKRIAFMSDRDGHFNIPGGLPNYEIYVMDADGGNQRNITNDPNSDSSPSWSPDGKWIAFVSDREGNYEIFVMDADGNNLQRLTDNDFYDEQPSWSPDGKRIVFWSKRDGHFIGEGGLSYEIYVMDADGGNEQRLTNNRKSDSSPSWSPDGKWIVFSADRKGDDVNYEIYVMDADGGNLQRLTNNRVDDWSPSWSPDSKWIVFASDRKGDDVNYEIYVMGADGGNLQRLTNNRVYDGSPSWSPDGKRIVFWSNPDGKHENYEIYVMDADGNNQQRLTNNPHRDSAPEWLNSPFSVSPAGKKFTMWGWLKQFNR